MSGESELALSDLDDQLLGLHELLEAMPDGVAVLDERGVIRDINEYLVLLTGFTREELIGEGIEFLVPPRHGVADAIERTELSLLHKVQEIGKDLDLTARSKDGSEIAVDLFLSRLQRDDGSWSIVTIRDITARRAARQILTESELRFRLAFEDNMAPMIFTDAEDRIIAANDAFCEMLGRTREELFNFDAKPFTYPDDQGITEEIHRRITHGEAEQVRYRKRYLHKNGSMIVAEVSKSPARDDDGNTLYYVISERDITETVKRDQMLELMAEVNKLAMHASDELAFLQQLCEVLVSVGGFALAWIGVMSLTEPDAVDNVCASGATDYVYEGIVSTDETKDIGRGPVGTALREYRTQVVNDVATHTPFEPWRERAIEFGLGSVISIPDEIDGRRAALTIYAKTSEAFDEATVKSLEGIVREAEFAIAHVRSVRDTETALEETTVAMRTLRAAEETLASSEQRFRLAFEENMAPMVFSDDDDLAIAVNDAFCDMVGYSREELLGKDSVQFTFPEDVGITEETHRRLTSGEVDQIRYVKRYLRKDGRVIVAEVSRSAARDASGKTLYFLSSERDITEERALNAQLSYQAMHDSLTGLPNRSLFEDHLAQAYARVVRQGGFAAVLSLDLDDFKGVNDTHGHLMGDQLLVGIARRLELATRSTDTLCRLGGDEFLYLAEGLSSASEAEEVANRLLDVLTEPFTLDDFEFEQRVSIGVVVFDGTITNYQECVQRADVALYEAKRLRRGRHLVFDPSMHQVAMDRFSMVQELRHALQSGELAMHYQPIFDLATAEIVGLESLMRWHHPEQSWITPDVFIPLAEQSELIVDLGAFAMRQAVTAAASWTSLNPRGIKPYVTVNLSAHQFYHSGLIEMIENELTFSGLPADRLIVEITERVALLDATETMNTLFELSRIGVGIALDDFGTGYSSLSYLALLLPSIIKIDRTFVSPALKNDQYNTLLEAIVSLGRKLSTTVLAEGIETKAQFERLRQLGCQLGQGYFFSPAVPGEDVPELLLRDPESWTQGG